MARLAVAHTRAVTKGPPHRRVGWKIRVGSFDSLPLTNGIGKLLYPTVNQDGEVIAGLVAIPEAAVHKFCPDAPSVGHKPLLNQVNLSKLLVCPSLRAPNWDRTRSLRPSARAAWAKSIRRATRGFT